MVQMPQGAAGLQMDEYDYDLINLATAGVTTTPATVSNVVPDGFTLKISRLTLTNKAVAGLVTLQIVANGAGVATPYGALATQTVFEWQLGSAQSQFFSEDQLELTVPAGFALTAQISAGTLDFQASVRYLKGGVA